MGKQRIYRNWINKKSLTPFRVVVKETDLFIHAKTDLKCEATELVLEYRGYIEAYIEKNPAFAKSLSTWHEPRPCPNIIIDMAEAGEKAGVGAMASVAGVLAQYIGEDLLSLTDEIIVENGGDIFIKTDDPIIVGIYAGKSPLSLKIGIHVDSRNQPVSVCTSSGTVGHSLSLGTADAVCVVSNSCALADAAATAIGNQIHLNTDIQTAIEFGKSIKGIDGIVVIREDTMGMWGDIEIIPLKGKKG